MSIVVKFNDNKRAAPYNTDECAPGLSCSFSDSSWHETGWNGRFVTFPESPKSPNTIFTNIENPSGPYADAEGLKGSHAGFALADLNSDVPQTYLDNDRKWYDEGGDYISTIYKPMSEEIVFWKILHVASNCNKVQSPRNELVQTLVDRGLVDSYGKCHKNKDWKSVEHLIPNVTRSRNIPHSDNKKHLLMRKYAFVTASIIRFLCAISVLYSHI